MKNTITYKSTKNIIAAAVAIISVFILLSCGGTSSTTEGQDYNKLQELVAAREFEVENDWAFPNNANNINLIGNPNYIKFKNDSVDVFLPYFGVRHSGGNYGDTEGGIVYKGPIDDYEVIENEEKRNIEIKFKGNRNGENLDFNINLFPNNKARTRVVSNQRAPISYEGKITKIN